MLKDTLHFEPELRRDADGGDGCSFHRSIVLQLQFTSMTRGIRGRSPLVSIRTQFPAHRSFDVLATHGAPDQRHAGQFILKHRGPLVFSAISGGTRSQHWRGGAIGRALISLTFLFTFKSELVALRLSALHDSNARQASTDL